MSVIVWDGKTLAADRQGMSAELRILIIKMRQLSDGTILAWTGNHECGLAMARWYEEGARPEQLPASQNKDDWSRLIVLLPNRKLITYEQYGEPQEVLDCPTAFGAGRDFAIGALAMGADARKAVEIACQFSVVCGFGVEAIDVVSIKGKQPISLPHSNSVKGRIRAVAAKDKTKKSSR